MTPASPRAPTGPGAPRRRPPVLPYVAPAVLYVVYIFAAGTSPDSEPPMGMSDKTAHAAAFGMMVPLFYRALRYFFPHAADSRLVVGGVALTSLAGAALEIWQAFLPFRSSEVLDWVADTVGAVVAGVLLAVAWRLAARRRGPPDSAGGQGSAVAGPGA